MDGNNKATSEFLRLSPNVGNADELSNFIKDFEKVAIFINAQHDIPLDSEDFQ